MDRFFAARAADSRPYGREAVRLGADLRDVGDAVPYGVVRSREAVRKPRDVGDAVPYGWAPGRSFSS